MLAASCRCHLVSQSGDYSADASAHLFSVPLMIKQAVRGLEADNPSVCLCRGSARDLALTLPGRRGDERPLPSNEQRGLIYGSVFPYIDHTQPSNGTQVFF